jgi:GAF domain-containing protein
MARTRDQVEARLARLLDYQRALLAFGKTASEAAPPERLLQHACAQISRVTHVRHTKVLRYREDVGDLLIVAGIGWKPGVVGELALPADAASPPGRSIQTAAPVIIEDLADQNEFRVSPVLREHGIVSLLNVPVMIDGRSWGVLEIDGEEPRIFDDDDVSSSPPTP